MAVTVGINIWSRLVEQTFPYLDEVIAPFESLWLPDHVMYNGHKVAEGWTLLAFALGRYPDKVCGHQVLCNSFRNPAHLAKMGATAQAISNGRFVLGIGAGWNEEEYLAYNWPFPPARVRIAQLAEALALIKLMWREAPATYQGEHYQIKEAYCEPRPEIMPPIMIGGAGEKYLLRVVAEHADWWNYIFKDRETYRHKQEVLKEHCRAVGRDYDEIEQVVATGVLVAPTEKALKQLQDSPEVRPINGGIAGTPEQVAEKLREAIDQGAKQIVLHFADVPRVDGTQLFAAEVMPQLG